MPVVVGVLTVDTVVMWFKLAWVPNVLAPVPPAVVVGPSQPPQSTGQLAVTACDEQRTAL